MVGDVAAALMARPFDLKLGLTAYRPTFLCNAIDEAILLDRRPQRLEGTGEVSDIVKGNRADCVGEHGALLLQDYLLISHFL